MQSAPGSKLLPASERQLFIERFEKDARFFQLFFLLIHRSCPIKNLDLVWVEHEPSGRSSLRHLGITEALGSRYSHLLGLHECNPHPFFCNIINHCGRHQAESCGLSDKAAEEVVRKTGRPHVYRCHFGLIDIAVPVIVRGQHIATIFTGQVLGEPPSKEGFSRIKQDACRLPYIDMKQLEDAYQRLRVVSQEDIRNTTEILEAFAEYFASSWIRLAETVRERRQKDSELQLWRKEFSYLVLECGETGRTDGHDMREFIRRIGFRHPPNRVLVVTVRGERGPSARPTSVNVTLGSAFEAIDDLCENLDDVVAAVVRNSNISVFLHDPAAQGGQRSEFHARRLATRILSALGESCGQVRIGVGGVKDNWRNLAASYHEACSALTQSQATIAIFNKPSCSFEQLSDCVERISGLVTEMKLDEARTEIESLPTAIVLGLEGEGDYVGRAAMFLSFALHSLGLTANALGCDTGALAGLSASGNAQLRAAGDVFHLHEIWRRSAAAILDEIGRLYSSKRDKIVQRACLMIEQHLNQDTPADIRISAVAAVLGVSPSHMSRTFKRGTGQTFERYVMTRRVEMAKRLLLDPLYNISQVAARCGFSDPSYFARVFRQIAGCSPSDYCDAPLRYGAPV